MIELKIHRRDTEDAKVAQSFYSSLRPLCVLCVCGGEMF